MGSLSHYINARATGYEPLPEFPEVPPPGDVRNVEPIEMEEETRHSKASVTLTYILFCPEEHYYFF